MSALCSVAGLVALTIAGCAPAGPESPPGASPTGSPASGSTLFAVQSERGSLTPSGDGQYTLVMRGTGTHTAAFADRPVRQGASLRTAALPAVWRLGGDLSFENDPPNAAITATMDDGRMRVLMGTLTKPRYDGAGTLTFTVSPLVTPDSPSATTIQLGQTSVLIDGAIPFFTMGPVQSLGWTDVAPRATPSSSVSFESLQPDPLTADESGEVD